MNWEAQIMPLKTSFFHKGLCKKAVGRFSVLWAVYTGLWFCMVPLKILTSQDTSQYLAQTLLNSGYAFGSILNFLYAACVCMALYGFLCSPRSAYAMAALPIRRETLFLTHYGTGLLFCLIPMVFTTLSGLLFSLMAGQAVSSVLWQILALSCLEYLFFFSFAVLCAMLTGSLVFLPVLYLILNFTVYILETIVRYILSAFLFGMSTGSACLSALSPMVYLVTRCGVDTVGDYASLTTVFRGWSYLYLLAAAGLVCAILSLLLYRKRRMESAGDVIAIPRLRPVFQACFTIGCSLVLGLFLIQLTCIPMDRCSAYPLRVTLCLLAGGFIGYFAAEMMLLKTIRVWKGHYRGFLIFAAGLCLAAGLTQLDPLGYETSLPQADEISRLTLSIDSSTAVFTAPEQISDLLVWHQRLTADKAHQRQLLRQTEDTASQYQLTFAYSLSGGKTFRRSYTLAVTPEEQALSDSPICQLETMLAAPDFQLVLLSELLDAQPAAINYAYAVLTDNDGYHNLDLTPQQAYDLLHGPISQELLTGAVQVCPLSGGGSDEVPSAALYVHAIDSDDRYLQFYSIEITPQALESLSFLESLLESEVS